MYMLLGMLLLINIVYCYSTYIHVHVCVCGLGGPTPADRRFFNIPSWVRFFFYMDCTCTIGSLIPRLSPLNDANGTGEPGIFCDVIT